MAWPTGWEWVPVVLLVVVLYEVARGIAVGAWKRGHERRIDAFLRSNKIPTDPFRHTHRVVVKEQVLADAGLATAIEERAAADGAPVGAVRAQVRAWLDEIVPQFNLLAYYAIGYRVGRVAAYSLYHVHLDKASLERAQSAIPKDAAVVFVSNHRSNADFIVTGFMLSRSVQVSYAVGEWARVWPLESLFKSFGSYFVRRGEKDPLYHRTLEAYLQLVTKQGVTQAMFPEGGLSRDGALRPVKVGLLDAMAKCRLDPTFRRPLVFVPVGINFDRVLEDEILVREARGEAGRPRRSVPKKMWRLVTLIGRGLVGIPVNVGRFIAKRMKKHGIVAIHFGEPIVFDEWYDAARGGSFLADPDRHARWERLRPFGELLMQRIGAAVPVTPVTMTCLALTRIGEARLTAGVDRGTVLLSMSAVQQNLAAARAPFATGDPYGDRGKRAAATGLRHQLAEFTADLEVSADLEGTLERALDVMARRGLLAAGRDGVLRMEAGRWPLVQYYANSLRAHAAERKRGKAE